ncbi:MAG: hypothetical protein ACYDCJ_12440 [Gammaproteobacteria bacterium]
MINKTTGKPETDSQRDWRLAFSAGLDDAIWYLVGRSVRSSNLSRKQSGERAQQLALVAMTLASAAQALAKKSHKLMRMTMGERKEIARAVTLANEANLKAWDL